MVFNEQGNGASLCGYGKDQTSSMEKKQPYRKALITEVAVRDFSDAFRHRFFPLLWLPILKNNPLQFSV